MKTLKRKSNLFILTLIGFLVFTSCEKNETPEPSDEPNYEIPATVEPVEIMDVWYCYDTDPEFIGTMPVVNTDFDLRKTTKPGMKSSDESEFRYSLYCYTVNGDNLWIFLKYWDWENYLNNDTERGWNAHEYKIISLTGDRLELYNVKLEITYYLKTR
jgi:hypothetical protein